jgi:hypothetical protein
MSRWYIHSTYEKRVTNDTHCALSAVCFLQKITCVKVRMFGTLYAPKSRFQAGVLDFPPDSKAPSEFTHKIQKRSRCAVARPCARSFDRGGSWRA